MEWEVLRLAREFSAHSSEGGLQVLVLLDEVLQFAGVRTLDPVNLLTYTSTPCFWVMREPNRNKRGVDLLLTAHLSFLD